MHLFRVELVAIPGDAFSRPTALNFSSLARLNMSDIRWDSDLVFFNMMYVRIRFKFDNPFPDGSIGMGIASFHY